MKGWKNTWNMVKLGLNALLDLFIPRRCIVCGNVLDSGERLLCEDCLDDIPKTYYWFRKNNPMADRFNLLIQEGLEKQWDQGRSVNEDYAYAVSLYFYRLDSEYRFIPYQLKYKGRKDVGRFFGRILGVHLAEATFLRDIDAVVPVPLHWRRRWSRGYNQAEVLAEAVAEAGGWKLRTDILERNRSTKTQTKLTIAEKALNVKDAFSVKAGVSGLVQDNVNGPALDNVSEPAIRHILIVDDVFTTGSTTYSCFLALRKRFGRDVRISIATLCFVGEV